MDGTTQAWRDAAHRLIEALARDNKYIVSDMVILFLESADYGLDNYAALGGAFRRAAKAGIIKKVQQPKKSKQSLWVSTLFDPKTDAAIVPVLIRGQLIGFREFGGVDSMTYAVTDIDGNKVVLERKA